VTGGYVKKLLIAALVAALAPAARAQGNTIKLGTLAPQNSAWHELLKELTRRWEQDSGGQVKLRVYAGGVQGSEGEMVRKMGVNQLQAASISNVGMHDVIPEPQALSIPFLFDSEAQMECAFGKIRPKLDAALERRGLVAVQWSRIGAIHLFCDSEHRNPADMRDAKVWVWEGDPKSEAAFRAAGLKPVVLSATDMVPSLQTGMIDCVPNVPLYVFTARLYEKAPYMLDLPWSWMMGATVVRKDAWEKIAPDVRQKLFTDAQALGLKVDVEVKKLNADAVAAMQKQGLKVVQGDPAQWRAAMEKSWPIVRGGVVPAEFFDEVKAARDSCKK
jgi:TRAP-type transport system periplasmic protein